MTDYRHTEKMGEISGFGGSYEEQCQIMLNAGVTWLMDNKDKHSKLEGREMKDVFGIFEATNDAAQQMEEVVLRAVANDCTGAMHHAVMQRLFWIARHGWDAYVEELEKDNAEEG